MPRVRIVMLAVSISVVLVADLVVVSSRTGDAPAAQRPGVRPSQVLPSGLLDSLDPTPGTTRRTGSSPSATPTSDRRDGEPMLPDGFILPPARGVYKHRTVAATSAPGLGSSEKKGVTTYTFRSPKQVGTVIRQDVLIEQKGSDSRVVRTNEWRADGLYRTKETTDGETCTFAPSEQILRWPLTVGDRWTVPPGSCAESDRAPASAQRSDTAWEVLRTESLTIDGRSVDTFVVQQSSSNSVEGDGQSATFESTNLYWFAPAYRLFVRTESRTHGTGTGTDRNGVPYQQEFTQTATSELVNLDPR